MSMSASSAERFREYAADCMQKATGAPTPEDKNLLLNMALAWVRLAHQSQTRAASADGARRTSSSPDGGEPGLPPN